jgi:hypothetical protein
MSDEIQDDLHDKLLKSFIEYIRYNERFERYGYADSSQKARSSLVEVMRLAKQRRAEIYAKRVDLHGPKKYYGKQKEEIERKRKEKK